MILILIIGTVLGFNIIRWAQILLWHMYKYVPVYISYSAYTVCMWNIHVPMMHVYIDLESLKLNQQVF